MFEKGTSLSEMTRKAHSWRLGLRQLAERCCAGASNLRQFHLQRIEDSKNIMQDDVITGDCEDTKDPSQSK